MPGINKYASILYRISQTYYDEQLEPYHISSGQQFFLMRIHKHPGISQQELAEKGFYDKGTTARAVKKLEKENYIIRKADPKDKRIIRLYVTKKGEELMPVIDEVIASWRGIITSGMSKQEAKEIEQGMQKIAQNAKTYAKGKRKRVGYGSSREES